MAVGIFRPAFLRQTLRAPAWVPSLAVAAPQIARPASDVSDGGWLASGGGADLFAMIDESVASDSDFIYTESSGDVATVALGTLSDPASSSGHVVRFRARAALPGRVVVSLYQGATLIAQWTETLTGAFANYSHTLTGGEADAITDYASLRIRFASLLS